MLSKLGDTANVADNALQSLPKATKNASPLYKAAGVETGFRGGFAGKIDRAMHAVNQIDPGYHVGRQLKKVSDTHNLPQHVDRLINNQIIPRLNKALPEKWQRSSPPDTSPLGTKAGDEIPKKSSSDEYPSGIPKPLVNLKTTPQQDLNSLMANGSIEKGSGIVTNLTPEMDLVTRVGNAFGAEVYYFGGAKKKNSSALGVRRRTLGNRVWINEYHSKGVVDMLNTVGHETIHLIRDVDQKAYEKIVEIIAKHGPPGTLENNIKFYVDNYKKHTGRDLPEYYRVEEGAATTVGDAFERTAFWEELANSPEIAQIYQKTFNDVMDVLQKSGKLTQEEFRVVDESLSSYMFSIRANTQQGATLESLYKARPYVFMEPDPTPLSKLSSSFPPNSIAARSIQTIEELQERMSAGIHAAMNYKVRGHTNPVTQDFARKVTYGIEEYQPIVYSPIFSLTETIDKMADSRAALDPTFDRAKFIDQQQLQIRKAIEMKDFSQLDPELHAATKVLESVNTRLFNDARRAGLRRDPLSDIYAEHYPRHLHPKIAEALGEVPSSSIRPAAADSVNNRASQSRRTMLFRDAWGGTDTFNTATVDHNALTLLSQVGVPKTQRIENASGSLRANYLSEIDPRIPVVRNNGFVDQVILLKKEFDNPADPSAFKWVETPVTFNELSRFIRVDSAHDLTTSAGRLAEHAEPVRYQKVSVDANGNVVAEDFELLTGRLDDMYDSVYKNAVEKQDRFQVLSNWMHDVGVNNLRETSGAFSGNALNTAIARFNQEIHTIEVLNNLPYLLAGGIKKNLIQAPLANPGVRPQGVRMLEMFESEYFSRADRAVIYRKVAALDPQLDAMSKGLKADAFLEFMDNLRINKELYKDMIQAGTFLKNTPPAIDDFLKLTRSSGAIWKAGVLTHPGRYTRDFVSGQAALIYADRWSASAFMGGYEALFNKPSADLLQLPAVKDYLRHYKMPETPENATRAIRQMYATFKGGSGNFYKEFVDELSPVLDAQRGHESLLEALPERFFQARKTVSKRSVVSSRRKTVTLAHGSPATLPAFSICLRSRSLLLTGP